MTHSDLLFRITARPDVFGGKSIIRDMRISVEPILSLLAQGVGEEGLSPGGGWPVGCAAKGMTP